jgi:hypothetical protein
MVVKRNTKTMLIAGATALIIIAIVAALIMVLSPYFQIANVVSGGH